MIFGKSQAWFHSIEWQNMIYYTVICCCGYQLIIRLIYVNDVICTEISDPSIDLGRAKHSAWTLQLHQSQ